jgi:hypothetical protein
MLRNARHRSPDSENPPLKDSAAFDNKDAGGADGQQRHEQGFPIVSRTAV